MSEPEAQIGVVAHFHHAPRSDVDSGYVKTEAKSFPANTSLSEVLAWATKGTALELFRLEISTPRPKGMWDFLEDQKEADSPLGEKPPF